MEMTSVMGVVESGSPGVVSSPRFAGVSMPHSR